MTMSYDLCKNFEANFIMLQTILPCIYEFLPNIWFIADISLRDIGCNIEPETGGLSSKSRNSFTLIFKSLCNLLISTSHSL